MAYKTYLCKCGQEVVAESQPSPLRWNDGHTCRFHLSDEDDTSEADDAGPEDN